MWKLSDLRRLLKKSDDNSDYIALMWPVIYPSYLGEVPEAHCTIVMPGKVDEVSFTKEQMLEALYPITQQDLYVYADVAGLEYFGPDQNIPVLRLDNTYLHEYREQAIAALARAGITWEENYPEYKPHCTVTDYIAERRAFPDRLMLAPVELWWGKEKISV